MPLLKVCFLPTPAKVCRPALGGGRKSLSGASMKLSLAVSALPAATTASLAQTAGPTPLPPQAPIQPPEDKPYPGTIRLAVDATDLAHHIFRPHETTPAASSGPMILFYPEWLPGHHSPGGPISMFSGLIIHAGKQ